MKFLFLLTMLISQPLLAKNINLTQVDSPVSETTAITTNPAGTALNNKQKMEESPLKNDPAFPMGPATEKEKKWRRDQAAEVMKKIEE